MLRWDSKQATIHRSLFHSVVNRFERERGKGREAYGEFDFDPDFATLRYNTDSYTTLFIGGYSVAASYLNYALEQHTPKHDTLVAHTKEVLDDLKKCLPMYHSICVVAAVRRFELGHSLVITDTVNLIMPHIASVRVPCTDGRSLHICAFSEFEIGNWCRD